MEVAGLVVGVLALAPLLTKCLENYALIKLAWNLDSDYDYLEVLFTNLELRLESWGKACGLMGSENGIINNEATRQAVRNTLSHVWLHLREIQTLKYKYGGKATERHASHHTAFKAIEAPLESSLTARPRFRLSLHRLFGRSKPLGLYSRARWIFADKNKLQVLVQQLRILIDDLENHTKYLGIPDQQRLLIKEEIQEINDTRILREIQDASGSYDDIVSRIAGNRLEELSERTGSKTDEHMFSASSFSDQSYPTAFEELPFTEDSSPFLSVDWLLTGMGSDEDCGVETTYISQLLTGAAPVISCLKSRLVAEQAQLSNCFVATEREIGIFQDLDNYVADFEEYRGPLDHGFAGARMRRYFKKLQKLAVIVQGLEDHTYVLAEVLTSVPPEAAKSLKVLFVAQHALVGWVLVIQILRQPDLWSSHSGRCQTWQGEQDADDRCDCEYLPRQGLIHESISLDFLAAWGRDLKTVIEGLRAGIEVASEVSVKIPKIVVSFH